MGRISLTISLSRGSGEWTLVCLGLSWSDLGLVFVSHLLRECIGGGWSQDSQDKKMKYFPCCLWQDISHLSALGSPHKELS